MSRPIHFEIHVLDMARAQRFYSEALAWTYEDYSDYAGQPYFGVVTGPAEDAGINGALILRHDQDFPPGLVGGAVLTVGVEDFDDTASRILGAGGTVALAKAALPGMAWQGYFLDTEGNVFGVHQPDENAA